MIAEISNWLNENQVLAIYVILPAISGLVAWFSSRAAVKRSIEDSRVKRNFDAYLRLSEYHQALIDGMRDDIAEFIAINNRTSFDKFSDEATLFDLHQRAAVCVNRIMMRVDANDPDAQQLQDCMLGLMNETKLAIENDELDFNSLHADTLLNLSGKMLRREFSRLKSDLVTAGVNR